MSQIDHKTGQAAQAQQGGFTFIEMVLTLAIMTIVFAITVLGGQDAQQPLKALNNAYDVALFAREAQVRGTSISGGGDEGVGVHFVQGSGEVIMFRDMDNDDTYDTVGDTVIDTIQLERGVTVSALSETSPMDITFRRPFVNARLPSGATSVTISVSAGGVAETVTITDVGRIAVE